MNILSIEDSQSTQEMLRVAWLKPILSEVDGAELYAAGSLESGIKLLRHISIDLIILDLNLPDSTGIATMEAIHTETPHTPVLVVSGYVDGDIMAKAQEKGFEVLSKGSLITDSIMWKAILKLFGQKSSTDQAGEHVKRAREIELKLAGLSHDAT